MKTTPLLFSASLLALSGMAHAITPYSCREGIFAEDRTLSAAQIVGKKGERAYLRADRAGCPEQASCKMNSYLIPGDKVLLASQEGAWACVLYPGKKQTTAGWLAQSAIAPLPTTTPSTKDWAGHWQLPNGNGSLRIQALPSGALQVDGTARGYGGQDARGRAFYNNGQLAGQAAPQQHQLHIADAKDPQGCQADLQWVAGYLVAHDNAACGGKNVRFNGVYRKR